MTPYERIRTAMSGRKPDRVPVIPKIWVDLGARLTDTPLRDVVEDPVTALEVIALTGKRLGVDAVRQFHFPPRRTEEQGTSVFEVDDQGRRLGAVDMAGGLVTHLERTEDYRFEDAEFMSYHHYWQAPEPVVNTIEEAKRIAVPDGSLFDELGWAADQEWVRSEIGDQLVFIGDCSSATFGFYVYLRGGMERAMLDLVENPALVHAILEKGVAIAIAKGKYALDHGMKILRLNDSIANMSVFSPEHWREFVFPHMKTVCDELHAYDPEALVYCHICGNTLPIARDLVETGLDCIGPLDPLGKFTPAEFRQAVDESFPLMGGVDTLLFAGATPEEVLYESNRCIRDAGENGAYILGSGCVIPRTARLETLEAHIQAAHEWRYEET